MTGQLGPNPGDPAGHPDGNDEAQDTLSTFVRFHPVGLFKHLSRQAKKKYADAESRNRYGALASDVALMIALATFAIIAWRSNDSADKVIAVFTAVLCWSTVHQWRVMRQQTKELIAQGQQTDQIIEKMNLEHRAWLSAEPPATDYLDERGYVIATIEITNTGKTPAKVFGVSIMIFATKQGDQIDSEIENVDANSGIKKFDLAVAPGAEMPFRETSTCIKSGDLQSAEIGTGAQRKYIVGQLRYTTATDEKVHVTRFCFLQDHVTGDYKWHREHNYMD